MFKFINVLEQVEYFKIKLSEYDSAKSLRQNKDKYEA